jgi:signal transduction histidine kinase
LNLELHVLDECAGHGHFALLKDRGAFDPVERELFLASERRGWGHQSDTLLHDLKGIMNSMQISLELLANPDGEMASMSPEEARQQRRIATIKADLARMTQALRALPGADGGGEPVATDFDARDVVREIFATLRQLVRRNNVELKLDLPDSALPVRGRRAWLKQALFNVALHRLNAMRAGGRLLVEAQATQQGMVVQLSNDVPDMRDGKGAESQRFFCLRQISGATDLRVARAVFESQGGAMEIVNGDGDSTVFVMRLPR